jgi:hypothetical protein
LQAKRFILRIGIDLSCLPTVLTGHNLVTPRPYRDVTASLERRVQEANLTVKGARAAKGVILEKQWLRSPLAGLVSDVRVKSVTGKGVSVEVVILEEERVGSRN